jgi:hypothetical protein
MQFPEEALKTLIAYLKNPTGTDLYDAFTALTAVLTWLAWLVFKSGLVTAMGVPQIAGPRNDLAIDGLQRLLDQHAAGVQAMALTVPVWLLPILKELLKELIDKLLP